MRKPKFKSGDQVYAKLAGEIQIGTIRMTRSTFRYKCFANKRIGVRIRHKYFVAFEEKFKDNRVYTGMRNRAWVAESSLKLLTELTERVLGDYFA